MNNTKHSISLDQVLENYMNASQEFDAQVLNDFINKYPEYTRALQRYAQIQLVSVKANADDVAKELISDEEMLPRQSKLLLRIQQIKSDFLKSEVAEASAKLKSISGDKAMQAAAVSVFGSYEHGEDLLLCSIIDSTSEVEGVPTWFFEHLSSHVDTPPHALIASLSMKRQSSLSSQRFSSKDKPQKSISTTWKSVVESCITDNFTKQSILKR